VRRCTLQALALAALLLAACTIAHAAPRIALVTMQPGDVYWSRFGHNAILVQEDGRSTFYNYGYFDFDEPGFLLLFLQGKMQYRLAALPAEHDLASYAAEGRGVRLQWLRVEPHRAEELARFLAWNALPENARYRYDYFTENCSTKVRDALDRALDGALRRQLQGRSRGITYRWESLRLAAAEPWLFAGIHAGLGPWTDRPLSRWQEGFVPMRLAEAVEEIRTADGAPLVQATQEVLPHRLAPTREDRPDVAWLFAGVGSGIAVLLLFGLRSQRRAVRAGATVLAAATWLLAAAGGALLAGLWAFTDHQAAWRNENLLLFNPLALALLAALPALWRGTPAPAWLRRTAMAVLVGALLAVFLKFLPWRIQDNLDWIVLWLPIHAALAWAMGRARD
jgi:hypothetical protein